jgi:hypothetical protein
MRFLPPPVSKKIGNPLSSDGGFFFNLAYSLYELDKDKQLEKSAAMDDRATCLPNAQGAGRSS